MTIKTDEFEYNYHNTQKHYNRYTYNDYDRHNIDIYTTLYMGDAKFDLVFQNAQWYVNDDYSCPCTDYGFAVDGGCDTDIAEIASYSSEDFENDETTNNILELIKNPAITKENIAEIHKELMNIEKRANAFAKEIESEISVVYID